MATQALDPQRSAPLNVFISYAHEDEKLKEQLIKHLSALKRQGTIAEWHDRKILPGGNWSKQIDAHLESTEIILLLISPDFLASDYCYDVEMTRALEKHESNQARVIPIFLRPCDWKGMPFGHLQGLPLGAKPVTEWPNRDKAFENITQGIRMIVEHFRLAAVELAEKSPEMIAAEKRTALHQLLSPPADFTGRADELGELLTAVKAKGARIVGIVGLGGSGKTTLALKLAEELTNDYADAQFQIDLKGTSKEPLTGKDAMAHVIRGFDLAAKIPDNDSEMVALYRSVLHKKQALLLLDNARSTKQVEPLLPPPGCLLLVTSRFHFPVSGLLEKNLDAMKPADAEALLVRIAPRLAQAGAQCVADLALLCGYLPLALRTAASALQVKRNLRPVDYVSRLQDTAKRLKELDQVQVSLRVSYELLPEQLQQRFRLLAVFPDTFDAAAAAAIWEVEQDVAEDVLEKLLLYSLVDFAEASSRYRLHDLVRLFADNHLLSEERKISQQRHAGHYLLILGAAGDLYSAGGDSVLKGLALFEVEWINIQKGQSWAATHANSERVAMFGCSAYANTAASLLLLRQNPRDRIEWLEAAVNAGRSLNDRNIEAVALGNLGVAYKQVGAYQRAIECHEQHLAIAREIGDRVGEAGALGNLGIVYKQLGEHQRAVEYHSKCLQIAQEIGDARTEGQALGNLGNAYRELGEYLRAIEYYDQSLRIKQVIGDLQGKSKTLGNLGIIYRLLGEHERAIEYHEQSLQTKREIGDYLGEGNTLWNISLVLYDLGDRRQAITRAEAAFKIFEANELPQAAKVRDRLAKWREEEKAKGQADE